MCRKFARCGVILILLPIAGFLTGSLLSAAGFIIVWWNWLGEWKSLTGLNEKPEAILAVQLPERVFLLQTVNGSQLACSEEGCAPAAEDWSQGLQACSQATQPVVVSTFPVLVSWNIETALGCELSYQSTGRTVFVIYDRQGRSYTSGGPTMIPSDAGVVMVGLLGGIITALLVLLISAVLVLTRSQRKKKEALADPR
jgi:hypothetical protein